jgi:hypothetical protein|tara:strand:- start:240 stop:401 length:162 start_codon:yes stop_codon:yes gene_type:complete
MKTIKFRKVENPMKTIKVNGVDITPDEEFDVIIDNKIKSLRKKFPNHIVVGGN